MKTLMLTKPTTAHPSAIGAAINCKCPKCRHGDMFANGMYSFKGQQMHKTCPECNYTFEIEPGYFYVAMFVSYAMNVAQMVTLAVATYILTGSESPWLYVGILLGSAIFAFTAQFQVLARDTFILVNSGFAL